MSVDRNDNDLSRFQFSCPKWWEGLQRGMRDGREQAMREGATWQASDWQRGKIKEGEAA